MKFIDLTTDPTLRIPRPESAHVPTDEVREILDRVRDEGDGALIDYTMRFDQVSLGVGELIVHNDEIESAFDSASSPLIEALEEAERRIRAFAQNQLLLPWREEIGGGTLGEAVHAVERAGIYVPGGRAAYPSTVLMCSVPASVAGVGRIAMCVPPGAEGSVPPSTLVAAKIAGVDEVYRVGGAQAIAALAYGTETVPKVEVIAGPGNVYVAEAKRQVAGTVGIDTVAGPSEIAILADRTAEPRLIALDLVAQAEHGPGGAFAVVTWETALLDAVRSEVDRVLQEIGSPQALRESLDVGGSAVLAPGKQDAVEAINAFAPEHLEILCEDPEELVDSIRNVGAIFIGRFSPVSLGDYFAGSNHVLPTGGSGRWASGLRASNFQRAAAVVWFDERALSDAAGAVGAISEAEGLPNHSRALDARLMNEN